MTYEFVSVVEAPDSENGNLFNSCFSFVNSFVGRRELLSLPGCPWSFGLRFQLGEVVRGQGGSKEKQQVLEDESSAKRRRAGD